MAEGNRVVTVGVDTHKDAHVAAALDASGALLGTASFPADARGYASMVAWMRAFGRVEACGYMITSMQNKTVKELLKLKQKKYQKELETRKK